MNKRDIGTKYEALTCQYLETLGYEILERNFRCRIGEIDIIAYDGRYLVFVEVKYRQKPGCGQAVYAVSKKKQHVISKVAAYYLIKNGLTEDTPCRFDVAAIDGNHLQLYKNAFEYCPY